LEANKDDICSTGKVAHGETHLLEGGISSEIHRSTKKKDSTTYATLCLELSSRLGLKRALLFSDFHYLQHFTLIWPSKAAYEPIILLLLVNPLNTVQHNQTNISLYVHFGFVPLVLTL
jgi:hypothetical protein